MVSILNRVGAAMLAAPIISCNVMFTITHMSSKSAKIMVLQTQIDIKRRSAANK